MPSLTEILKDPNYTNANEATKKAIFDKYSAQDVNFTGANAETQNAIRSRFGVMPSVETVFSGKPPEQFATEVQEPVADANKPELTLAEKQNKLYEVLSKHNAPPTELEKGAASALTNLKALPPALSVQMNVNNVKAGMDKMSLYEKIDKGEITDPNQIQADDITAGMARMYMFSKPELRNKIKERTITDIKSQKDVVNSSIDMIKQYQKENLKNKGKVQDITDVEGLKDFGNWAAFNFGSGAVQLVPIVVAAAATGGGGLFLTGTAMELSGGTQTRLQFILKETKDITDPQEKAEKIRNYIVETGDVTLAAALASGTVDRLLGPSAALLRQPMKELTKELVKKEAGKKILKEGGKQAVEEFIAGGTQEAISIAAERKLGEQTGDVFSPKNVKRVINAAFAEALVGLGAGAGMSAARMPTQQGVAEQPKKESEATFDDTAPTTTTPVSETAMGQRKITPLSEEQSTPIEQQKLTEQAATPTTKTDSIEPNLVTEQTFTELGVGKTNKSLRSEILNKDLSDPAQIKEIRIALEAYAAKPRLSQKIKDKVNNFLERPEFTEQPLEEQGVITPIETQQAEAQGAQAATAAPTIEAQAVEQPTPVAEQPSQEFFNPLEADSYEELTDLLGLPEDATQDEVMERADYMGHDAVVYDTPEGKKSFALEGAEKGDVYENVGPNIPPVAPDSKQEATRQPSLKREIDQLNKDLVAGKLSAEEHSAAVVEARALDKDRKYTKPIRQRSRGADFIRQKILEAKRRGEISEEEADLTEWFISQNPALADDLGISIRTDKADGDALGTYSKASRIFTLFKNKALDGTGVHEMLHHMERMMPAEVQAAIRGAWKKKFNSAKTQADKGKDEAAKKFFELLDQYHFGDPQTSAKAQVRAAVEMVANSEVPADFYQYVNPSEFWAVNASRIMQNRFNFSGSTMGKLKTWLREFLQKIKGITGLPSDAPIIRTIESLIRGDGKFQSQGMLMEGADYLSVAPKPPSSTASAEAKAALKELDDNNMNVAKPEPNFKERMATMARDAIDNPKLTAQSAAKAYSRFLNKIETVVFSSDAAINNDIRGELKESTKGKEEILGALLEVSLSQTVHADAIGNNLLQYGKVKYNEELHKWEAIQVDDNIFSLGKQLDELATKHGITRDEAQRLGHTAFEARRTNSLAGFADQMQSEARGLFQQANAARAAAKQAKDIGDNKTAAAMTAQSKKFAKEAQTFYKKAPFIHMSPTQVDVGMKLFEKFPELNKIADTWQAMRQNTKDMLIESGLWSEEYAERMMTNIDYVPFYRVMELEKENGPREFVRGLEVQAKEKRLKGSDKAVNDVFDNMARWMQYAANRSVRNRSAVALADAAVENGLASEVKADERSDPNVTRVWKDGEEKFYKMDDPLYMDAFQGLETIAIPTIKAFTAIANFLRNSVVLNPIFTVAQIPQDSFAAMFTSGIQTRHALTIPARAVKEFVLTLGTISKTHGELKKFGAVGVRNFSAAVARLDSEVAAGIKAPPGVKGKISSVLHHIAMAGDNAVRQATYEASLASGRSQAESIEKAFQLINFRNKGSSRFLAIAGQTVPFFNAYIAVQHVAYKTLTGRGISPENRATALTTLATTSGAVMALSLIYSMMNGDDKDYLKKPATTRDRLLMIPGTGGLSIPLRKDIFLFPKIIAEHTYLLLAEKGYEDARKFRDSMASTLGTAIFSPTPLPQALKTSVEIGINYNFFQARPIIPAHMQNMATERKFNDGTSELAKILGKTGVMAPINIDHFVKGYFGSVGGASLVLSNTILHSDPTVPRPELTFREVLNSIPGTSTFLSKPNESALKSDFYVLMEECNKAANTLKDIEKRTPHKLREALKDKTMLRRADMADDVNKVAAELSEIRNNITYINNAPESRYSAEQKQIKIQKLRDLEEKIFKSVNVKKLRKVAEL